MGRELASRRDDELTAGNDSGGPIPDELDIDPGEFFDPEEFGLRRSQHNITDFNFNETYE